MTLLTRIKNSILSIDRSLLVVLFLCALASWSFIFRPSLPRGTDVELHVIRNAEWAYAIRAGDPYPRWASDFYFGYGYPIFNYYAPLTYLLGNVFSLAIPEAAVSGIKLVMIATFFAAGIGMWGAAREKLGSAAGMIAASCYLFAPYVYLIDPHLRGAVAEFLALGTGPLALWGITAYRLKGGRSRFVLASIAVALLILSHNLLGLVTFALLAVYTVWMLVVEGKLKQPLKFFEATLPLIGGVMLAAFFWLPVALEQDAVQLSNLVGPGHFDFRNHFLDVTELLGPVIPLDLGAINPAVQFNVGMAQWILALMGFIIVGITRQEKGSAVFWAGSSATLIFLIHPRSLAVWEAVPQAAYVQFPWRFLGVVALPIAMLAAHVVQAKNFHIFERSITYIYAVLIGLPIAFILPIFVPPDWEPIGLTNRQAILDMELSGLALGTTSTGDYVPSDVDLIPAPNPTLIDALRSGATVDRVNRSTLPENASVDIVRSGPTRHKFHVISEEDFVLRLYIFMFEGWRAEVDGEPVRIDVAKPEGFITVPITAGEHDVRVWFGSTPARTAGVSISVAGLISMLVLGIILPAGRTSMPNSAPGFDMTPIYVGLGIMTVTATVGGAGGLFQPRSVGVSAIPAEVDRRVYLQGGIDLIGYSLAAESVSPGETIPLTLYWKAREPAAGDYQVFAHLNTSEIQTWAQVDKLHPGDYPTSRWSLDQYIRDPYQIYVPDGTPPGEYELHVGLWNLGTGVRQLVLDEDATVLGDSILVGEIEVLPVFEQQIDIPESASMSNTQIAPGLALIAAERSPEGELSQANGLLVFTLYWQSTSDDLPDYEVALRVVDEEGNVHLSVDEPPAGGQFPFSDWSSGMEIRDIHAMRFDEALPAGEYTLELSVYEDTIANAETWIQIESFIRTINDNLPG